MKCIDRPLSQEKFPCFNPDKFAAYAIKEKSIKAQDYTLVNLMHRSIENGPCSDKVTNFLHQNLKKKQLMNKAHNALVSFIVREIMNSEIRSIQLMKTLFDKQNIEKKIIEPLVKNKIQEAVSGIQKSSEDIPTKEEIITELRELHSYLGYPKYRLSLNESKISAKPSSKINFKEDESQDHPRNSQAEEELIQGKKFENEKQEKKNMAQNKNYQHLQQAKDLQKGVSTAQGGPSAAPSFQNFSYQQSHAPQNSLQSIQPSTVQKNKNKNHSQNHQHQHQPQHQNKNQSFHSNFPRPEQNKILIISFRHPDEPIFFPNTWMDQKIKTFKFSKDLCCQIIKHQNFYQPGESIRIDFKERGIVYGHNQKHFFIKVEKGKVFYFHSQNTNLPKYYQTAGMILAVLSIQENNEEFKLMLRDTFFRMLNFDEINNALGFLSNQAKNEKYLNLPQQKYILENILIFFQEDCFMKNKDFIKSLAQFVQIIRVSTNQNTQNYYSYTYPYIDKSRMITLDDSLQIVNLAFKILAQQLNSNIFKGKPQKLKDKASIILLFFMKSIRQKQSSDQLFERGLKSLNHFLTKHPLQDYKTVRAIIERILHITELKIDTWTKFQLRALLINSDLHQNNYGNSDLRKKQIQNFLESLEEICEKKIRGQLHSSVIDLFEQIFIHQPIYLTFEHLLQLHQIRKFLKEPLKNLHQKFPKAIEIFLAKEIQTKLQRMYGSHQGRILRGLFILPIEGYESKLINLFFKEKKMFKENKLEEIIGEFYLKSEKPLNFELFNDYLLDTWKKSSNAPSLQNLIAFDKILATLDPKSEEYQKLFELTATYIQKNVPMDKYVPNFRLTKKLKDKEIQDIVFKETCLLLMQKEQHQKQSITKQIQRNFRGDEPYLDKIYAEIFQDFNESEEQIRDDVINCLMNDYSSIPHFKLKYHKYFAAALKYLRQKIAKGEILEEEIIKIVEIKCEKKINDVLETMKVATEKRKQLETLKINYKRLDQVMSIFMDIFVTEIQELKTLISQFPNKMVCDWNHQKYNHLQSISEDLQILIPTEIWDSTSIKDIDSLIETYENTLNIILQMLDRLMDGKLPYSEYSKAFNMKTKKIIFSMHKKGGDKYLSDLMDELEEKNMQEYLRIISALQYFNTKTLNQSANPWFIDIARILSDPENQILDVCLAFDILKKGRKEFKNLMDVEMKEKEKEEVKLLLQQEKYQKIEEMIERNKLCINIIEDLKEYINDIEHSILRLDHVKSFETVLLFTEILKKSENIQNFIELLKEEQKSKAWLLSRDIEDSFCNLTMIEQKIDESKNRETSFKYDIGEIFNYSHLIISIQNYSIKITVKVVNTIIENDAQEKRQRIFEMKTLQSYKDKSLLLVTDSRRQKIDDETTINIIELMKDYLNLFQIIQKIETKVNSLLNYGYDPSSIEKEVLIKEKNFDLVERQAEFLEHQAEKWIEAVKQAYNRSYILTNFVSEEFYLLIQNLSEGLYVNSLDHLFGITEEEYIEAFMKQNNEMEEENVSSGIQKLKKVFLILDELTQKKKSKIVPKNKHSIEMITCKEESEYYCYLAQSGTLPRINQILYCQEETSLEAIDCFLKRALLKNEEKHYILAVHNLSIEKQQQFCDLLNNSLRTRQQDFYLAQLCFVDRSIVEKVYVHLCRGQIFKVIKKSVSNLQEKTSKFVKLLQKVCLITSESPGQGKTYSAQKLAKKQGKKLVYFPICGNVNFTSLSKRLKRLKLSEENSILLQIGHVENKRKLQIFLSQIVMFRAFNYEGFQFLPKNIQIYIEVENILQSVLSQERQELIPRQYNILKMIEFEGLNHLHLERFSIEELDINVEDEKQHFILLYLDKYHKKEINSTQFISYHEFSHDPSSFMRIEEIEAKKLIQRHFIQNLREQPTYRLYKYWVKLFFEYVSTFSNSIFFNVMFLEEDHNRVKILELNRVREVFLGIAIRNSIQFLEETENTNEFQSHTEKVDFRHKLQEFPLLILPTYDRQGFQFVYLDDRKVQLPIKSLKLSQETDTVIRSRINNIRQISQLHALFHQNALNNLTGVNQEIEIFNFINRLSNSEKFRVLDKREAAANRTTPQKYLNQLKEISPDLNQYSITLDNFFKMCLIIQRMRSQLPIVLMGESGVGKTALIKFLTESVFKDVFLCFNVHAGINEEKIIQWAQEIFNESEKALLEQKKLWVFFDQFNTTDEVSFIKEIIIDRRFQGKAFLQNIVFLAACNPFRRKQIAQHKSAGLKKHNNFPTNSLAFQVKLPPLAMISVMWDYQQLQQKENFSYISKMVECLQFTRHQDLVHTITQVHEYLKMHKEISSVSLRDVYRFKQIALWFLKNMPHLKGKQKYKGKDEFFNENYKLDPKLRAILLSLGFSYGMRLSENKQRLDLFKMMKQLMKLPKQYDIGKILENEQNDYVRKMQIPNEKIALNRALRENVFVILICIMNKIPVLVVGNPGNSKSLSIRMLASNLRGKNSSSQFCRKLPEFNMVYFQGSEACTSKGIQQVFEKVKASKREFEKKFKDKEEYYKLTENCIYFDEIGLAEKSVHNPLKVLHAELETNNKEICFIGISNWQLDASKMSRFLILARSTPDLKQLHFTAQSILESYIEDPKPDLVKRFHELAGYYKEFIQKWDQGQGIEGFFGLRDFYCYIKYVCEHIVKEGFDLQKVIFQSIATNFDGQPGSLDLFYKISNVKGYYLQKFDPLQIVNANLENPTSRCLLLIIRGDALVPLINRNIKVHGQERNVICMYGSTFKNDKSSEEYNLEITSLIISHISRGNILAFKDINSSIETSLYDLFNKSFYQVGTKKYCRIAVGANLNPKCLVHKDFNAIVFIDETNIPDTDLAFLNRFEKHYLNLKLVAKKEEQIIIEKVIQWRDAILDFTGTTRLKKENFIINCCEESIVTLVIKYREIQSLDERIRRIKEELLLNSTLDLKIAIQYGFISKQQSEELQIMIKNLESQPSTLKKVRKTSSQYQKNNIMEEERMINEDEVDNWDKDDDMESEENQEEINLRKQILSRQLIGSSSKIKSYENYNEDLLIFTYDQNLDSVNSYYFYNQGTYKFRLSSIKGERELRQELQKALKQQKITNIHIIVNYERQNKHIDLLLFICQSMKIPKVQMIIIVQISRFSLINEKINAINISYLHKFKQIFVEDLVLENRTENLLQIANMADLVKAFHFDDVDEISQLYAAGLQAFNFRDMSELFKAVLKLSEDQIFKKKALEYVLLEAKKLDVDFKFLILMKDKASFCASIHQAIRQHVVEFISTKLITLTDYILRQSLVYLFPINIEKSFSPNLLSIYNQCENEYNILVEKVLNSFFTEKTSKNISVEIQGNMVANVENYCFPFFKKYKQLIFKNSEEEEKKIEHMTKKMFELHCQNQEGGEYGEDLIFEEIKSVLVEPYVTPFESLIEQFRMKYSELQKIFIRDFLVAGFGDQTRLSSNIFSALSIFFCTQLSHFDTTKKIVFFLSNKKIIGYFLQFLNSISEKTEENFTINEQLITEYEPSDNPIKQMIEFINLSVENYQKRMFISKNIVEKLTPQKYFEEFNSSYYFLQKIRISFQRYNVKMPSSLKICKKLLELFSIIGVSEEEKEMLLDKFSKNLKENDFQSETSQYLIEIRQKYSHVSQKAIDGFLSLEVYPIWIKKVQLEDIPENQNKCLNSFIEMCNKSPQFANNGASFIQYIFDDFLDLFFDEKWDYLKNPPQKFDKNFMESLTFKNNFSVAVGNFLFLQISKDNEIQLELDQLFDKFEEIQQENYENNLEQLASFEFCKNFLLYHYLNELEDNNVSETVVNTDNHLCKNTQMSDQLRLFLLKNLLEIYGSTEKIKEEYINKKKCNWILQCQSYLQTTKIGLLVPPPSSKAEQITSLIDKFLESRYQDTQALHDFIKLSFENTQNKFQFLNFLLINCYNRVCPLENIHQIEKQISERGDLNEPNNKIEIQLIRGYLMHQITPQLQFKEKMDHQEFQALQLFELVVINFFVANRFQKCPLIEVFFNMHGCIPQNYSNWLDERFLPVSRQNLSARVIRLHLQANKPTNLHHCSHICDYIYEIDGCQQPMEQKQCPWCHRVIGGKQHKYTRANEGARPIVRAEMEKEYQAIREKCSFNKDNADIQLKGFTYGNNIFESLQENERIHKISLLYIFNIIGSFWSFLASSGNLTPREIEKTFKMPQQRFLNTMRETLNMVEKQLSTLLNLNGQELLVWKLGILTKLMQTVANYQQDFQPPQKKMTIGLVQAYHRDKLQEILSKQIMIYVGGHEKADLIKECLKLRESELNHSAILLKQQFDPEFYMKSYPKIRLLKLNSIISLENFKKDYQQSLKTTHPILSCLFENNGVFVDGSKNAILFKFIGKLISLASFKIAREEASRIGFKEFVFGLEISSVEKDKLMGQYKLFVERWNELAKDHILVKDMCRQLGSIQTIDEDNFQKYPIINFLPDRDHPQNRAGFLILSFLAMKAEEYNEGYQQVHAILKRMNQYKNDPIFNTDTNNIMNLSNFQQQKLAVCLQEDIWKYIDNYSSMSVQYGIKVPNYPLQKIQSVIVETFFVNKNFIQSAKEKIETVSFIGELSLLIFKIHQIIKQEKLEMIGRKSDLQNQLIALNRKNPDTYHKYLKKLLGQIEFLMFYCKNLKPKSSMTISQFLNKSHLQKNASELMSEPFLSLPLSVIVDLYETVESKTFDQDFRLDPIYCEKLNKEEIISFQTIKKLLKDEKIISNNQGRDLLNEMTIALYRFTTRMLFMMKVSHQLMITDWLGQEQFWPKEVPFFSIEQVEDVFRIPISKMGSVIKFFSDNIKQTLQSELNPIEKPNKRRQQKLTEKPRTKKRREEFD